MTPSGCIRLVPAICAVVAAEFAFAQSFPTRPVRLVTSPIGGASDFVARLLAPGLAGGLGQPVVADNRGGGVTSIEIVAKAPADGHTLLYFGSLLWLLPLMQNVSYDALRDFIPVSMAVNSSTIVTVNPALPVKSIKDLIALAKARPGVLNYASSAPGSTSHLAMELFKALAGVDIVRVAYKGGAQTLGGLIAGEVQVFVTAAGAGLAPHLTSGKVRALAVGSARRSVSFPNLPTVAEAGLPGYEYGQMSGVFAPARTPAAVVDRLNREIVSALNRAEVKDKLTGAGFDIEGSTPQQAAAEIKSEIARLGKVIRDAKIRMD